MNGLKATGGIAALLTKSQKKQVKVENQKADEKTDELHPSKPERDSYDSDHEAKPPWLTPVLGCPFVLPKFSLNAVKI